MAWLMPGGFSLLPEVGSSAIYSKNSLPAVVLIATLTDHVWLLSYSVGISRGQD